MWIVATVLSSNRNECLNIIELCPFVVCYIVLWSIGKQGGSVLREINMCLQTAATLAHAPRRIDPQQSNSFLKGNRLRCNWWLCAGWLGKGLWGVELISAQVGAEREVQKTFEVSCLEFHPGGEMADPGVTPSAPPGPRPKQMPKRGIHKARVLVLDVLGLLYLSTNPCCIQSCPSPFLSSFSVVETWGRWSQSCSLLPRRSPRPGNGHLQGFGNAQSLWQAGGISSTSSRAELAGSTSGKRRFARPCWLPLCPQSAPWFEFFALKAAPHCDEEFRTIPDLKKGRERWHEETEWPRGGGGVRVDDNGALWKRLRQFGQLKL